MGREEDLRLVADMLTAARDVISRYREDNEIEGWDEPSLVELSAVAQLVSNALANREALANTKASSESMKKIYDSLDGLVESKVNIAMMKLRTGQKVDPMRPAQSEPKDAIGKPSLPPYAPPAAPPGAPPPPQA